MLCNPAHWQISLIRCRTWGEQLLTIIIVLNDIHLNKYNPPARGKRAILWWSRQRLRDWDEGEVMGRRWTKGWPSILVSLPINTISWLSCTNTKKCREGVTSQNPRAAAPGLDSWLQVVTCNLQQTLAWYWASSWRPFYSKCPFWPPKGPIWGKNSFVWQTHCVTYQNQFWKIVFLRPC